MDLTAFVNANREWVSRAGARWAAAALSIDGGTYEVKHLVRDLFRSSVGDSLLWFGDILRESDASRILILVQGIGGHKSGLIPVPHPQATKITSLVRLGGNEEMRVSAVNPADINVILDKPPENPGSVQVTLQNLTNANHPPGQYLGFIYEDQRLIADVVALR
jgi:hypothetical protein